MADEVHDPGTRLARMKNLELFELLALAAERVYVRLYRPHANAAESKRAVEEYASKLVDAIDPENRALLEILSMVEFGNRFVMHSFKVTILSLLVAKQLGLPERKQQLVAIGALLHDLGKTPGKNALFATYVQRARDERELSRLHPQIGAAIARDVLTFPAEVEEIIARHHEQSDGEGFPGALSADALGVLDRIVFTANFVDNMLVKTDYSGIEAILGAMRASFEKYPGKFDPTVSAAFLAVAEQPVSSRRKWERFELTLPGSYRLVGDAATNVCRILDISGSGARFRTKADIALEKEIKLSFVLSGVMSFTDRLGVVRSRIADERGWVYTVEFTEAGTQSAERLDRYLRQYTQRGPGR